MNWTCFLGTCLTGYVADFEIVDEIKKNLSYWLPYMLGVMDIDRLEYKYATQKRRDLLIYCATQSIKVKNGEGLEDFA